ncbi:MAG: chemotaxis protein CheB [Nanoarchaeota archaeon]
MIEDSVFYGRKIREAIDSTPGCECIGWIYDQRDVGDQVRTLDPDAILLDSQYMDDMQFKYLKEILAVDTYPIVLFVDMETDPYTHCMQGLDHGAVDFLIKPLQEQMIDWDVFGDMIVKKLVSVARAYPCCQQRRKTNRKPLISSRTSGVAGAVKGLKAHDIELLVIASSTGGVQTLKRVVPLLPKNFPVPIMIIQHMPAGFTREFAHTLDTLSAIHVKEVEDEDLLQAGTVYIARGGRHVVFRRAKDGQLHSSFDDRPPVWNLKPYANYSFRSAAEVCGARVLGVVLSGMGHDGTDGVRDIKAAGGVTVAQSAKECVLYGMPKSAMLSGYVDHEVDIAAMADALQKLVGHSR